MKYMAMTETPPIDYTKHVPGVTTTHHWKQGGVASHMVMNRDFSEDPPKELDIDALKEQFKYGVPSKWINTHPRIFVDRAENPTLLAKVRRNEHEEDFSKHPDQTMGWLDFRHEFQVAYDVANILSSTSIQASVQSEGFNMLVPVMPILGIDVVDTKERIVIYPFVSGIHMDNEQDPKRAFYLSKVSNIVRAIRTALELKNIKAMDLTFLQFIVNPETNTLYLIDMEGYFKKTK